MRNIDFGAQRPNDHSAARLQLREEDVAQYLLQNPDFLLRAPDLLTRLQLPVRSGKGGALSLQERQLELLREKVATLEARMSDMLINARQNMGIVDKLLNWTKEVMLARDPFALPILMVEEMKSQFQIPQAGIRLWGVSGEFATAPFAQPVSASTRAWGSRTQRPYCGPKREAAHMEAASWMEEQEWVISMAIMPLRVGQDGEAFGIFALGSPNANRYTLDMDTRFLELIGEIASAALLRLFARNA